MGVGAHHSTLANTGSRMNTVRMTAPPLYVWLSAAADATGDGGRAWRLQHEDQPSPAMSDRASPDDVALIARLRADDETALEALMRLYSTDVARVAYHYVRNEDTTYDIAQEVFVAVWNRRHALDDRTSLVHYLRRAARNRALNALKQHASRAHLSERLADDATRPRHAENLGPMAARAAEVDTIVRKIVDTLTPRVREVLLLYYERGLEPREISSLLGIAPRTVYVQLRTALRALAVALVAHDTE